MKLYDAVASRWKTLAKNLRYEAMGKNWANRCQKSNEIYKEKETRRRTHEIARINFGAEEIFSIKFRKEFERNLSSFRYLHGGRYADIVSRYFWLITLFWLFQTKAMSIPRLLPTDRSTAYHSISIRHKPYEICNSDYIAHRSENDWNKFDELNNRPS